MVWNYPDMSLEDMMKLVKGFVDVMILASGYQSSGLLAHWDAHNIKKAFQFGVFFENVLRLISSSDFYQDSLKELDEALSKMTSDPSFPKGLASLSCYTLNRARNFVLSHMFHNLPMRDSHLRAFLTAIIEMDLDKLSETEHNCIGVYLSKLELHNTALNRAPERRCIDHDLANFTLQEVFKRRSAVSCILTAETGLDILSNAIRSGACTESDSSFIKKRSKRDRAPASMGSMEQLVDFVTWNRWKSNNLSYFLDKRTIRLVSGANIVFSTPTIQWVQVFERLNASAECKDNLQEMIELLLLGCISSKWNRLIEFFMSVSYDSYTVSKLCHEVCNILPGRSQDFHSKEEARNSKESGILEYLARLLGGQFHPLWKLSPVLAAIAIPLWSPLFRLYLSEVETQFKGHSSTMRCCSCIHEHEDCQLAERIWCLYIFHVCGFHVIHGPSSA